MSTECFTSFATMVTDATNTAQADPVLPGQHPYSSLRRAGTSPSPSRSLVGYWLLISHVVLCGISIAV